jgi:hypothetical protein
MKKKIKNKMLSNRKRVEITYWQLNYKVPLLDEWDIKRVNRCK